MIILKTKIILEVNVKPRFYQSIINRNILYKNEVASSGIVENEDYKNIPLTFLVNFNTFFINSERRKTTRIFIRYYYHWLFKKRKSPKKRKKYRLL